MPSGTPMVIVHSIFSPTALTQAVLVERAWDGRHFVWQVGQKYDPNNPIYTGGGAPELLAEIDVETPTGAVIQAFGGSGGVYRLPLSGANLTPGGTYRLSIRTAQGEHLSAGMTMPVFPAPAAVGLMLFDASSDTLNLNWPAVDGARAYQVVVQNVHRTWSLFTESTTVRLPGGIRNTFVEGLPALFLPGFDQGVSIVAVDSNYYDYYRSSNNQNTGRGLANRIEGGLGVFGASAPVIRRQLRTTSTPRFPIEGTYDFLGDAQALRATLLRRLTIHVSAHAATTDALSGRFSANPLFPLFPLADTAGAFVGRRWKDSLEVTIFSLQQLVDTIDVFKGRVSGDTIIGRYRIRGDTARLVRSGALMVR